jgi:predicted nucleic acid-binding protein
MIYLDSSVVFSVQVKDRNTLAAVTLLQSKHDILALTQLCEVEFVNALYLRLFRKDISESQAQASLADFEKNLLKGIYQLLPFPNTAFDRAKELAQTLTPTIGVRAANLLHVAAAVELGASSLFTFDRRQHRTAKAAGLTVNPLP